MIVKQVTYSGSSKKFSVKIGNKEYTCYIHPFNGNGFTVITGNGKEENYQDITDTKLGVEIYLHCK